MECGVYKCCWWCHVVLTEVFFPFFLFDKTACQDKTMGGCGGRREKQRERLNRRIGYRKTHNTAFLFPVSFYCPPFFFFLPFLPLILAMVLCPSSQCQLLPRLSIGPSRYLRCVLSSVCALARRFCPLFFSFSIYYDWTEQRRVDRSSVGITKNHATFFHVSFPTWFSFIIIIYIHPIIRKTNLK